MARFEPFRGIRYRLASPEEAGLVVCPPYDVIDPEQQAALERRDPRNVVRLELPRAAAGDPTGESRYSAAAELFRHWLSEAVLAADPGPALYLYGQQRETVSGPTERLGLLGALGVEPFEARVVLPHEQTFPKHKEDRFRLASSAGAQFSPIFGLYDAAGEGVRERLSEWTSRDPDAVAVDAEEVAHRLWVLTDATAHDWARDLLAARQVFIADGHHRYETALRLKQESGAAAGPHDYVMTFLVEMSDPGLVLLPTHRLYQGSLPPAPLLEKRLAGAFSIEAIRPEEIDRLSHHQVGLLLASGAALRLTLSDRSALERSTAGHSPAWRGLDVVLLHRLVLGELLGLEGEIGYTRDPQEARRRTLAGEVAAAFFLPAPSVAELRAVSAAGERMPEKSTYFWPKAYSGLVIYPY